MHVAVRLAQPRAITGFVLLEPPVEREIRRWSRGHCRWRRAAALPAEIGRCVRGGGVQSDMAKSPGTQCCAPTRFPVIPPSAELLAPPQGRNTTGDWRHPSPGTARVQTPTCRPPSLQEPLHSKLSNKTGWYVYKKYWSRFPRVLTVHLPPDAVNIRAIRAADALLRERLMSAEVVHVVQPGRCIDNNNGFLFRHRNMIINVTWNPTVNTSFNRVKFQRQRQFNRRRDGEVCACGGKLNTKRVETNNAMEMGIARKH
eukprot:gene9533-biopygen12231